MKITWKSNIIITTFIIAILLITNSCTYKSNTSGDTPDNSPDLKTSTPKEIDSVLYNPFMGWVPWAHTATNYAEQPYKLVYASVTWKELEPKKGSYDFAYIEKKNNFEYWKSKGVKIILQLNMDYPDNVKHRDIPDWLFNEINGDGTWYNYNNENTKMGFSPNYKNPVLIQNHKNLIQALAKKYDNDSRIFMILIGSCGHWGEWHTTYISPDGNPAGIFPPIKYSDQYAQHYADYFDNKFLAMRYPSQVGKDNKFGLFNNCFGSYDQTQRWFLDWIYKGHTDSYNPGYTHPDMPDFWLNAPSGGEFGYYPGLQFLEDSAIDETLRQARETHVSWLGTCCPVHVEVGDKLQPNIDKMMKTMGYRFIIQSVTHANTVKAGSTLDINMDWYNKGVAPFYFKWPIELSLADSSGKIVAKSVTDDDITTILPGGPSSFTPSIQVPSSLPAGQYKLCVSILDPETMSPGIQLAIEGKRSDGRYTISTVNVTNSSVTSTITPIFFFTPSSTKTNTPAINTPTVTPTNINTITPTSRTTPTKTATSTGTLTTNGTSTPSTAVFIPAGQPTLLTPTSTPSVILYAPSEIPIVPSKTEEEANNAPDSTFLHKVISFTLNSNLCHLDDEEYKMDAFPIIYHNRMLIPIRYLSEATGASVRWIKAQKSVVIKSGNKELKLWIGKNTATLNGKTIKIDENDTSVYPIIVSPGRTMLPLRFITENLGYNVEWIARAKTAKLTIKK